MSLALHLANVDDAPLLAQMHARCFARGWDSGSFADLILSPGVIVFMAEKSGFVVARVAADEAEILSIGVLPDARGQGFGAALVSAAAAKASSKGAQSMFLEVASDNAAARTLYDHCGFRPVGVRENYYEGADALTLKAVLPLTFRMGNPAKSR